MAALTFLVLGLLCALTSRILLLIAAVQISAGWAIGVLFPFGPLLFRLNYPEAAQSSRWFRYATIPCLFLFFVLGPGPGYRRHVNNINQLATAPLARYSMEKPAKKPQASPPPGPQVELRPSGQERRALNLQEFQRLRVWNDALKLRKRDLLHSDTEGNRVYNEDLAKYNAALAKATAEKTALAADPR